MQRHTRFNKFHLLSVSNVIPLKRVELIIQALSLLAEDVTIHWTHFGDGESMAACKRLAAELLGSKQNITYWFMGHQNNEDILRYYSSVECSCFITTSSAEGMPFSIMEALAFGLPIIGTDVGGIEEQIDVNGVLLPSNPSVEEIARAILQVYNLTPEEVFRYRTRSYQIWDEKFNADRNTRRFLDVLRSL